MSCLLPKYLAYLQATYTRLTALFGKETLASSGADQTTTKHTNERVER